MKCHILKPAQIHKKKSTECILGEPKTHCSEKTAGAQLYLYPGYSQELKGSVCPLSLTAITVVRSDPPLPHPLLSLS